MLTLPRDVSSRAMMSSIDSASPVMNNRPWISAMVGLMPHRPAMFRHRATNSCSTESRAPCSRPAPAGSGVAGAGCIGIIPCEAACPIVWAALGPIKGSVMGYHVRVKICGVTRVSDVEGAAAAGADAVGLNFHPPSPRSVSAQRAGELLHRLPPFVAAVGVFVRKKLAEAGAFLAELERIRIVQVHGGEPEVVAAFPWYHIPAFQVRDTADLDLIRGYLDASREAGCLPSAILLDGHAPGLTGGTGVTA